MNPRIWMHAAASLICLPFQLSAEVARGVKLARGTEAEDADEITHGPKWKTAEELAHAEAERDVWEPGELTAGLQLTNTDRCTILDALASFSDLFVPNSAHYKAIDELYERLRTAKV